jgi:hypothetical protein
LWENPPTVLVPPRAVVRSCGSINAMGTREDRRGATAALPVIFLAVPRFFSLQSH